MFQEIDSEAEAIAERDAAVLALKADAGIQDFEGRAKAEHTIQFRLTRRLREIQFHEDYGYWPLAAIEQIAALSPGDRALASSFLTKREAEWQKFHDEQWQEQIRLSGVDELFIDGKSEFIEEWGSGHWWRIEAGLDDSLRYLLDQVGAPSPQSGKKNIQQVGRKPNTFATGTNSAGGKPNAFFALLFSVALWGFFLWATLNLPATLLWVVFLAGASLGVIQALLNTLKHPE